MSEKPFLESLEEFLQTQCETSVFPFIWQWLYKRTIFVIWAWRRLTHPNRQQLSDIKQIWPPDFPPLTVIKELQMMTALQEFCPDRVHFGLEPELQLPILLFSKESIPIVRFSLCRCCPMFGVTDLRQSGEDAGENFEDTD